MCIVWVVVRRLAEWPQAGARGAQSDGESQRVPRASDSPSRGVRVSLGGSRGTLAAHGTWRGCDAWPSANAWQKALRLALRVARGGPLGAYFKRHREIRGTKKSLRVATSFHHPIELNRKLTALPMGMCAQCACAPIVVGVWPRLPRHVTAQGTKPAQCCPCAVSQRTKPMQFRCVGLVCGAFVARSRSFRADRVVRLAALAAFSRPLALGRLGAQSARQSPRRTGRRRAGCVVHAAALAAFSQPIALGGVCVCVCVQFPPGA